MTTLAIQHTEVRSLLKPEPRLPISIRVARLDKADLKFIDQLQKKHSKMVGFMPLNQLEKRINSGGVLIAEQTSDEVTEKRSDEVASLSHSVTQSLSHSAPVGYCIFADKYFKREDLGIIYHLNITPGKQRGLVGAALVKAAFESCPWGVKLFCCWCAQDLQANYFWESIGFVPIAFRAGSRPRIKKSGEISKPGRTHIFWQRRIREGDTDTPYWFPSETSGGLMRENRIALPIPPGSHWSDAMPCVLPGLEQDDAAKSLPGAGAGAGESEKSRRVRKAKPAAVRPAHIARGGLWTAPPGPAIAEKPKREKPARQPRKNDPKFVAAARELRDRYLEEVNAGRCLPAANGKYDVSRPRMLEAGLSTVHHARLLDAA